MEAYVAIFLEKQEEFETLLLSESLRGK